MKVLCIDASMLKKPTLVIGVVYTVMLDTMYMGYSVYYLEECERDQPYLKSRFIPWSDIDETELVNTKEEVYA